MRKPRLIDRKRVGAGHTAGQMCRWNLKPRLCSPIAQMPAPPAGASREGKEIEDRGGATQRWEGKGQSLQHNVRLQPWVWIRAPREEMEVVDGGHSSENFGQG